MVQKLARFGANVPPLPAVGEGDFEATREVVDHVIQLDESKGRPSPDLLMG